MKTIFGSFSAALAGATAQSIAAAANSGRTVVLNLRFMILYPFIRLLHTGWSLLLRNEGTSKSLHIRRTPIRGNSSEGSDRQMRCTQADNAARFASAH